MAKKGTQYSGFIKDFLQADLDVAGKPLRELVRSIAKKDNHAPPRWTTKQGRKVAGKVLEHAEFVPKLLRSMKVLKGDVLADVISVLTWLSTADKAVVEKIEENKIIDCLSGNFTIPDKTKEKTSKSLTPITIAILDMLLHVLCNRSRLDVLLVSQKLQISINQKIISSGLAHKVIELHREIYTRPGVNAERILPVKVLCQFARRPQASECLMEEGIILQLVNRLSTCPDDAHAAEFICNVVRAEGTHRMLRTNDFLITARKVMQTQTATESSKIRMVLVVAYVYGRRSEVQTFLETHAMPADVASALYNVVGDADGDLEFTMKGLKELLSGRSGYAAAATARAAAKLLLGAEESIQKAKLEASMGPNAEMMTWMAQTLTAKAMGFRRTGDPSGVLTILYLVRHSLVLESSLAETLLASTTSVQNLVSCLPDLHEAAQEHKDMLTACGTTAMFVLSYSVHHAPPELSAAAIDVLTTSPGLLVRMKQHLAIPDQSYDTLSACMHLLGIMINAHIASSEAHAVYILLKEIFDRPLAKLLGATVGVKCAPLARQALSLLHILLQHIVQVKSEFPDSLASKRLDDWSEMLFEMQAVPKVLMVLGMSSDKALLDAGVQIVSNLVQLGFSDRLVAAIPVLVSQCAQHPADTTRSRPILAMASKRELRLALRESKILSSIKSWLEHREGDSKMDLLASLGFLYSGEETAEDVGKYLLSNQTIQLASRLVIAACTSADDYAITAGLRWSAVDSLNILCCLSSSPDYIVPLLKNGCGTTAAAALSKYLHKPSRAESLHASFLKVSAKKQPSKKQSKVQDDGKKLATSSAGKTEEEQTGHDAEAAALDAAIIEQANELLPVDKSQNYRHRPEPLLACRIILNWCAFSPAIESLMEIEGLQAALLSAADSSDKRLSDMAVSCLVHLEVLELDHLAVKSSLNSARSLCWRPSNEPQFDVFISHVHTEAREPTWHILNMLNILGLRVFMNTKPHEDDAAAVLDLIPRVANFVLILSETSLDNHLCLEEVKAALACNISITVIQVTDVRWRDRNNKNVLLPDPTRNYRQFEELQEVLNLPVIQMRSTYSHYESFRDTLQERVQPFTDWRTRWREMPLFNFDESGDEEEEGDDDADDTSDEEFDGEMNDTDLPYRRSGSASSFAEDFVVTDKQIEPNNREERQDPDTKFMQSNEPEIATANEAKPAGHKIKPSNHRHAKQQQQEKPVDGTCVASGLAKEDEKILDHVDNSQNKNRIKPSRKSSTALKDTRPLAAEQNPNTSSRKPLRAGVTGGVGRSRRSVGVANQEPPESAGVAEDFSGRKRDAAIKDKSGETGTAPLAHSRSRRSNRAHSNRGSGRPQADDANDQDETVPSSPALSRSKSFIGAGRKGRRLQELEAQLEDVLENAESELDDMVNQEVTKRMEVVESKFQKQFESYSRQLQSELQQNLTEILERQNATQLLVEKTLKVMQQRIEKMEERTAEATTAAAGALAAATSVHRQLEAVLPRLEASRISAVETAGTEGRSPMVNSLRHSGGVGTPMLPPLLGTPPGHDAYQGEMADAHNSMFVAAPWTAQTTGDDRSASDIFYNPAAQQGLLEHGSFGIPLMGVEGSALAMPPGGHMEQNALRTDMHAETEAHTLPRLKRPPIPSYEVQFSVQNSRPQGGISNSQQDYSNNLKQHAGTKALCAPKGLPSIGGSYLRGPKPHPVEQTRSSAPQFAANNIPGSLSSNQQQQMPLYGRTFLNISKQAPVAHYQ